jgi:hypothetical protein
MAFAVDLSALNPRFAFRQYNDQIVDQDAYIKGLSEDQLRNIVLIPLPRSLGLRDVIEYHGGSTEKGKDLIGHYEGPLGGRHYMGVVAKIGDIMAPFRSGAARQKC